MHKNLGKGEVSRASEAKRERNNASLLARVNLLKVVISAPNEVDDAIRTELRTSLISQGGLAALDLPQHGITPMSLNTLKVRCSDVVTGGFTVLEHFRKQALIKLCVDEERRQRPSRGSKKDTEKRLDDLNKLVALLHNQIALMSASLMDYVDIARSYAEKAGELPAFDKRQRELLCKYNQSSAPLPQADSL